MDIRIYPIVKSVEEKHMLWKRRFLLEWVWFALTVSCSSLLWNLFFLIRYPEESISYFWDFLFTSGDWEFRLPVIMTIALVYVGRWVVWWTKRSRLDITSQ